MLNYAQIKNKPGIFQSLTGLTQPAFARLVVAFQRAYERALDERDAQREIPRQRRRGGGRKAVLATAEDKLVFILFYFKFYFQGYEPEQTTTYQPKKKPRKGELTAADKKQNQAISRERIGVEHSIGGVKVFRIVRDIYRNHRQLFEDLIMETACGLHNLRLDCRLAAA